MVCDLRAVRPIQRFKSGRGMLIVVECRLWPLGWKNRQLEWCQMSRPFARYRGSKVVLGAPDTLGVVVKCRLGLLVRGLETDFVFNVGAAQSRFFSRLHCGGASWSVFCASSGAMEICSSTTFIGVTVILLVCSSLVRSVWLLVRALCPLYLVSLCFPQLIEQLYLLLTRKADSAPASSLKKEQKEWNIISCRPNTYIHVINEINVLARWWSVVLCMHDWLCIKLVQVGLCTCTCTWHGRDGHQEIDKSCVGGGSVLEGMHDWFYLDVPACIA